MLDSSVLVLNRSYFPVNITSAKRAFCMLYQDLAKVITADYQLYDFESWNDVSAQFNDYEPVQTVSRILRIPRVIILTTYDRVPKRQVRFSRANIYLRDASTCQYCGKHFQRQDLNLDHVQPRSLGGRTTWENIVCSCIVCNRKKGGNTPEKARMKLLRKPFKPKWSLLFAMARRVRYEEWKPFVNHVDLAYWDSELDQE